jgi:hypothetical protein
MSTAKRQNKKLWKGVLDILDISRVRTSSHPAARLWMPNYWEYGIPM